MDISFYLKRPDADTPTTLFARISYDGFKLKHYIPEKINPKFWNSNTQRAKETEKFKGYPEFNKHVND
ncbi:MAG: site-specific integrase, partial [Chitinophagaceae bacterium]|nr:site-specific integrase [Chitinophagaceae bacterium]